MVNNLLTQRDRMKAKELKMKRYAIGLITGILLTASAVMFMGSVDNNVASHYHYAYEIYDLEDHSHDYAESYHTHYDYADSYHSHDYAESYHTHY